MPKVARVRCSPALQKFVNFAAELSPMDLELCRALRDGGMWMKNAAVVASMRPDLLRKRFRTYVKKITANFPGVDFEQPATEVRQVSYDQHEGLARHIGVTDGRGDPDS